MNDFEYFLKIVIIFAAMLQNTNLFDKITPKWQARINRCFDITRMLANKSPEKAEIMYVQLKDSIYAHLQSRLEAFIFVFTNICFVWPSYIPQAVQIYKFFDNSQSNENVFGKAKQIIYKQLFHWYFGDRFDDAFFFVLQIFLQCIEQQVFDMKEFISKLKKKFIKKSVFCNQLSMIALYFSPEIEKEDIQFFQETRKYIQQCQIRRILSPKVYLILLDYEKYQRNNWEYLKKNRKIIPEMNYELFSSFYYDDIDKFIELIQKEQKTDNNKNGPVLNAILENPPLSVFTLFDNDVPYINAAAIFGAEKIFAYLYESGVSLHSICKNGATIDQCACICPKPAIISILEKENVSFANSLPSFAHCFDMEAVNHYMYLISKTKMGLTPTGTTPVNMSIMCCNSYLFRICLEKNPDIDLDDQYGMRPLDYSCQFGNIIFYKSLLLAGADISKANPAFYAANYGNSAILNSLLKNDSIDMDKLDEKHDVTPLKGAIMNSHYEVVKLLVNSRKVDLSRRFKSNLTYINFAASQNDIRILKLILENTNTSIASLAVSPLFNSIHFNCIQTTEYLLNNVEGINPNKLCQNADINALWLAVKGSCYDIVEMILEKDIVKLSSNEVVLAQNNQDSKMVEILGKYELSTS